MSTVDDKAQEAAAAAAEAAGGALPESGKQGAEGGAGPIVLSFILGLAASMILGWVVFPKLLYSQKEQPINFNHVLHMEQVDEGCESCHYFREDGSFSGIPKLESCAECHEEVMGESESEAVFVEQYVSKGIEVPWHVYAKQPACVFFSHAAHVKLAGMDCVSCHGHIGETEKSRVYEENRITGYSRDIWGKSIAGFKKDPWDRMKMDDCAQCHAETGVGVGRDDVKNPVESHFLETVRMIWPSTVTPTKGTSVQTEKDGCLVCHK